MNSDHKLFKGVGFCWDRSTMPADVKVYPLERVCFRFQRMLPEFVWDAAVLEGNPFTYPEGYSGDIIPIIDGFSFY